jgi:asparagine synthase (glutamine-hydrolysing)
MCGIAGFFSDDPKYDRAAIVKRMLQKIPYRGPDQVGIEDFSRCALGMVRLSIIDPEDHEIPICDENRRAIVYNGEIYNYADLKAVLQSKYTFKTKSDAEVVLYGYCEKGVRAFDDFNGMYAFAIWDAERQELLVARDKTGEKPLYYCKGPNFFAFASEIKCLLEVHLWQGDPLQGHPIPGARRIPSLQRQWLHPAFLLEALGQLGRSSPGLREG